jgi:hypothetical protein
MIDFGQRQAFAGRRHGFRTVPAEPHDLDIESDLLSFPLPGSLEDQVAVFVAARQQDPGPALLHRRNEFTPQLQSQRKAQTAGGIIKITGTDQYRFPAQIDLVTETVAETRDHRIKILFAGGLVAPESGTGRRGEQAQQKH